MRACYETGAGGEGAFERGTNHGQRNDDHHRGNGGLVAPAVARLGEDDDGFGSLTVEGLDGLIAACRPREAGLIRL